MGTTAFAVAACLLASGFAAWMAGIGPTGWQGDPQSISTTNRFSFDDRFGSASSRNTPSIYYPSRRVSRAARLDFDAEFGEIEYLLADQSHEPPSEQPERPRLSAVAPAIPLPRSRPTEANFQLATASPSWQPRNDPAPARSENRSLLQKLSDLVPVRLTLASLEPNGGILPGTGPDLTALGYDEATAVYDISARTVFMPDGTKLEAHSGFGNLMDDPAHVHERNVGATPPSAYDLKPRERPFHGVEALRMIPAAESDTLGRSGLLTHSYMLGPNGDSNGCVSFKNYDRFLKAYKNGEVRRLVVVPNLSDAVSAARRSTSQS